MLYTYLYQKNTTDCSWDIAHLYEHAVVYKFFKYLSKNGIDPSLMGWMDAQAFEHSVFFYGAFYNKKIADLFNEFIAENNISDISIDALVSEIGIEDNVIFSITDQAELNKQFDTINKLPWTNVDSLNSSNYVDCSQDILSPLSKKKSAKSYRKVVVSYSMKNGTSIDKALFFRWSVILDDIIAMSVRINTDPNMICHGTSSSPVYEESSAFVRIQAVTFPKTTSLESIKKLSEDSINNFDIENNFEYIKDHFNKFAEQSTWRDFPIDYFRETGILTSNKYIGSLCTIENIKSIDKKIKVKVCYQTPKLKKHMYNQ